MKAIVYKEFGLPDVLHLEEIAKPTPKANEILIRNHATTVNFGDLMARNYKAISPRQFNMPFLFWLIRRENEKDHSIHNHINRANRLHSTPGSGGYAKSRLGLLRRAW